MAFKDDVEKLILEAKIGNRNSFKKLWEIYYPIIILNVDRFCHSINGFSQYRDVILYDSHIFFWDVIGKYSFEYPYGFGYYLNDQLLVKTSDKIRGNKLLPQELIDQEKLRAFSGYKDLYYRSQIALTRDLMKKLSPKQLQAVYFYHYRNLSQREAAKEVGISQVGLRKRLVQSHTKIKKFMKRIIENERKKKHKRIRRSRSVNTKKK